MQLLKNNVVIVITLLIGLNYAQQKPIGTLSIADCVAMALKNNPQLKGLEGVLQNGRGNLMASRAGQLPQLNFQTQIYGNNGSGISSPSYSSSYSANLQVQQLIYDFGKTSSKVSSAQSLYNAAQYDSATTIQNLITSTFMAYINLLESRSVVQINREALKQTEDHLNKAQILYDAGRGLKYDVVKASVDKANADLNLSKSRNAERISLLQLQNLTGEIIDSAVLLVDTVFIRSDLPPADSAIIMALQNRSELQSLNMKLQSTNARLTSAKRARLPSLTATGSYGYKVSDFALENLPPSWNIGAILSVPLFTGGAQKGAIEQADGEIKNVEASLITARQAIILDVQQQLSSCTEAIERVDISDKAIEKAKLALSLAQERYYVGSGNAIEVSDAEIAFENSKIAQIQARCDYRIAKFKLSRAMGINLFTNTKME
ncbi:MAG TPA: TolC family protein [Chitinispirillaceae bacterium]|nr:TolC family protein [Chitinispirillaceae bacterium]